MATLKEIDGKKMAMVPEGGCATCMFTFFSCGTGFTGKVVMSPDGETATFSDNTVCFCLKPSPIPCCMYCGIGPCAMEPKMKKESDTKLVGSGESVIAAGCCKAMFHNKGDVFEYKDGKWVMHAGSSPAYPPCLQV